MIGKRSPLQNIILTLAIVLILFFCLFPFVQILSTSLKYQFDWGNPSLIPIKVNLKAYQELLGLTRDNVCVPATIEKLLDNPLIPEKNKKNILAKYRSTSDIFPFLRYFLNSFLLSSTSAAISLFLAVFGAYSFSRLRFKGTHSRCSRCRS